jgi:hypothetical protein
MNDSSFTVHVHPLHLRVPRLPGETPEEHEARARALAAERMRLSVGPAIDDPGYERWAAEQDRQDKEESR